MPLYHTNFSFKIRALYIVNKGHCGIPEIMNYINKIPSQLIKNVAPSAAYEISNISFRFPAKTPGMSS